MLKAFEQVIVVVLYWRHWKIRRTSVLQNFLVSLNVSMYFLNSVKQHRRYSCLFCRQLEVGRCNLFQFTEDHEFAYFHHSRGKRYRMKIVHGRYHRSFRYRHNACRLPSSWNSICGETRIRYNAHTNLASCSALVVQRYLGQWFCWESHAETHAESRPLYVVFER